MPYAVATIATAAFLAGLATAHGRWVSAGFLVGMAVAVAWWLRTAHFAELDYRFRRGVEYAHLTGDRLRDLPEAHEVPKFVKKRYMANGT
jgi:hypothetical protein